MSYVRPGLWCALLAVVVALLAGITRPAPTASALERLPLPPRDPRADLVAGAIDGLTLSQLDEYRTIRLGSVERPAALIAARGGLARRVFVPPGGARYEVHAAGLDGPVPVTIQTQDAASFIATAEDGAWTPLTVPLRSSGPIGQFQTIKITFGGDPDGLAAWGQEVVSPLVATPRPDIYLISLDTVRRDQLTPYAPSLPTTPVLARLMRESVLFEEAISTSSWTVASHATLFTGAYPADTLGYDSRVEPGELTLAERFAAGGYRTFGVSGGPYTDPRWGLHQGFDEYVASAERENAVRATTLAADWLGAAGSAPVFMFLNYFNAHEPLELSPAVREASGVTAGISLAEWHALDSGRLPFTAEVRERLFRAYRAEISAIDRQLGRLFEVIAERGRWDRSIVIVWSDHGQLLGERDTIGHAFTLEEELLRIPLIVKPPRGAALTPGRYPGLFQGDDLFLLCQAMANLPIAGGAALLSDVQAGRPVRTAAFAKIHHEPLPALVAAPRWRSATVWATRDLRWKVVRDLEGRTEAYDVRGPGEVALSSPAGAPDLLTALNRFIRWSSAPAAARTVDNLPPEELERLRSLGYIHR
jgi:arylsulfatase A-like enzyme